jgi:uncharacterized integral membrane protein
MTNLSRPVKFVPDTLVKRRNPLWPNRTYVVDHNSGIDSCWVNHRFARSVFAIQEEDLRALYWYEFAFHRDPMKGHWMIGKNRALPLLYALAILLAGTIASLKSVEGAWKWACPAILAMFLTGTIIGTVRNAKGKQF